MSASGQYELEPERKETEYTVGDQESDLKKKVTKKVTTKDLADFMQ